MIEFNFMSNSRYLLASKTKVRLPTHKETMFSAAENDWDEDQLGVAIGETGNL